MMAIHRITLPLGAVAAVAMLALPATAANKQVDAQVIQSNDWDYGTLYKDGFSADDFLDAEVVGKTGDEIGEVEDMVVGRNGRVTHLIVETGGFLDIGDRHVMVPIQRANITGMDSVTIDMQADRIGDFSLFGNIEDKDDLPGRRWRISELIGDYAYLKDEVSYGWVDDVVMTSKGEIKAVVVNPDVTYGARGPYAVPYYGWNQAYDWDPGRDYYMTPYSREELERFDRFDRTQLKGEFAPVLVQ